MFSFLFPQNHLLKMAEHPGTVSCYSDAEFLNTCKELENPDVEGWEFFVESHGVTIYRLYNEVCVECSGLKTCSKLGALFMVVVLTSSLVGLEVIFTAAVVCERCWDRLYH
jgi:hypothetical protein